MEKLTQMSFKLKSLIDSPILFNRRSFMIDIMKDPSLKKQKGEDDYTHQLRIFKKKAEYDLDGHILILGGHFKKAFQYSQGQNCHPIAPKGVSKRNANLNKLLPALFIEDIKTNYTADDLVSFDQLVCIQNGMKKSSVLSCRPMLKKWEGTLNITSCSDLIGPEEVIDMLQWCGILCGIGDWRPERGGKFGRFEVIK